MGHAAELIELNNFRSRASIQMVPNNSPPSQQLTWREVMACHKWHGHISNIWETAREAGYSHFEWNGRVYRVLDDGPMDTTILVSQVR